MAGYIGHFALQSLTGQQVINSPSVAYHAMIGIVHLLHTLDSFFNKHILDRFYRDVKFVEVVQPGQDFLELAMLQQFRPSRKQLVWLREMLDEIRRVHSPHATMNQISLSSPNLRILLLWDLSVMNWFGR